MSRSPILLSVLAALLTLAIGSRASSASRPTRSSNAAPVLLQFNAQMPPGGAVSVRFLDGVQAISNHTASATQTSTGTMRLVTTNQQGFGITASGTLGARIDVLAQPTAGSAFMRGQAAVGAGSTLTVQVNGGTAIPIADNFAIPLPTLAGSAPKAAARIGTAGNDVLVGTEGADVIVAKGGNDRILGGGGNDYICAGPGNDSVTAGSGHDQVLAGPGNDVVRAGRGHDYVSLGPGRDRGHGGAGNDGLIRDARDTVTGGPGADQFIREPTRSLASRAALSGCRAER
jgi:Ca2+-binding RTX toxin-like protein